MCVFFIFTLTPRWWCRLAQAPAGWSLAKLRIASTHVKSGGDVAATGAMHRCSLGDAASSVDPSRAVTDALLAAAMECDGTRAHGFFSAVDFCARRLLTRVIVVVAPPVGVGLSGRALRKLPFLTYAEAVEAGASCGAVRYVRAMAAQARAERVDRQHL